MGIGYASLSILSRLRILIVDDNVTELVDLRQRLISSRAEQINTVGDARQALSYLKRHPKSIDVIISEWSLPLITGADFFDIVRKQFSDIRFLVFSRSASRESFIEAKKIGVDGYYLKSTGDLTPLQKKLIEIAKTLPGEEKSERAKHWGKDPGRSQPVTPGHMQKDSRRLGAASASPLQNRGNMKKPTSQAIETADIESPKKSRASYDLEIRTNEKRKDSQARTLNIDDIVDNHEKWLASKGQLGERACFDKLNIIGADLSERNLRNASFRKCDMSDTNCKAAHFDGADFREAVLSGSVMVESSLSAARLRHASLDLCDLQKANLRGADMAGAILRAANTAEADFTGAGFLGVNLSDVNLKDARGLVQEQINQARADQSTQLPVPLRPKIK